MNRLVIILFTILVLLPIGSAAASNNGAKYVQTPYNNNQKMVVDFYFNEPADMNSALYWLRSYMNTLMDSPYDISPYDMKIKVIVHGAELVTLAKKNYKKYKSAVDRMQYYADLGVEFRICGLAMNDYGYRPNELHNFVKIAPSAMTELVHWQSQGYALLKPEILDKKYSIEEIR